MTQYYTSRALDIGLFNIRPSLTISFLATDYPTFGHRNIVRLGNVLGHSLIVHMNRDFDSVHDLCQLLVKRRAMIALPLPHKVCQFKNESSTHDNTAVTCQHFLCQESPLLPTV